MEHPPPSAWFLGPKSEQRAVFTELVADVLTDYQHWRRNYFPDDPSPIGRADLRAAEPWIDEVHARLQEMLDKLKAGVPIYHPRYLAHMVSEQSLPAVLGHFATMLYNANNATEELSPVTTSMELAVGRLVAEMLGYEPDGAWAHITSGGTLANLEALWVARQVQFAPLALRDVCSSLRMPVEVKMPNGTNSALRRVPDADLLYLAPGEAVAIQERLAEQIAQDVGRLNRLHQRVRRAKLRPTPRRSERLDLARQLVAEHIATSEWNPAFTGLPTLVDKLGRRPVVFAPESAHYSIKKACDVLGYGYGEDSLRLVPVTGGFRLDIGELRRMLRTELGRSDTYVAAVIGVLGTTEAGAVDPIHELVQLRADLEGELGRSFWLHVDAAWGGYIASLFRGHGIPGRWTPIPDGPKRAEVKATNTKLIGDHNAAISLAIGAPEPATIPVEGNDERTELSWCDRDISAAFLALAHADSITVDPHKLGYIPYPAGLIAFRDKGVKELVGHKASYITEPHRRDVNDLGAHILEGSKPGAAAAACWLAHRAIPLRADRHGTIVASTLLSARRLAWYLDRHQDLFQALGGSGGATPFTFTRIGEVDTNIVCFVARPMQLGSSAKALRVLNDLNRCIYDRMGRAKDSGGAPITPYHHPFFVSRTELEESHYRWSSVKPHFQRLGFKTDAALRRAEGEYRERGLFVLRSTVMNPHYGKARRPDGGKDYLFDFVRHLHEVTRACM